MKKSELLAALNNSDIDGDPEVWLTYFTYEADKLSERLRPITSVDILGDIIHTIGAVEGDIVILFGNPNDPTQETTMKRRAFIAAVGGLLFGNNKVLANEAADALATAKALREAALHRKPTVVESEPKLEPTVVKTTVTYRQAQGHSHTCANGHTWDHAVTLGHSCPVCGLQQFIQDNPTKLIPMTIAATISEPVVQYTFPGATSSGCPNGQCGAPPATVRRGLFR